MTSRIDSSYHRFRGDYTGEPVDNCGGCFRAVYREEKHGEWDDFDVMLHDGTTIPYNEYWSPTYVVKCISGCYPAIAADEGEGSDADRAPSQTDTDLAAMVPETPVEIEKLMVLWDRKERATKTIARRLAAANLIEPVKHQTASRGAAKVLYKRVEGDEE